MLQLTRDEQDIYYVINLHILEPSYLQIKKSKSPNISVDDMLVMPLWAFIILYVALISVDMLQYYVVCVCIYIYIYIYIVFEQPSIGSAFCTDHNVFVAYPYIKT